MNTSGLVLASLLHAILVAGASGSPAPLTLAAYAHTIHVDRLALDRLGAPMVGSGAAGVGATRVVARRSEAQVRASLRRLARVRLPDGRVLTTATPLMANELLPASPGARRDVLNTSRVASALDALDDALRTTSLHLVAPRRLRALDTVLRDPRFHPPRSFMQRIANWLNGIVAGALDWLARLLGAGVAGANLWVGAFAILLLALVAGLGYLLARRALQGLVVAVPSGESTDIPVTSQGEAERARRAAADGDYREALRHVLLSTLLTLQDHGVLELRPGLTNREYLQELRAATEERPIVTALAPLIDAFDDAWYGHLPFGADDFARCERLAHQIQSLADRGQAA